MQKTAAALITYAVAACALLAIAFGPQAVSDVHEAITFADSRATPAAQCEEDQPCWDCATMGNHICGTAATVETVPALDDEHAVCATDPECAQWDAQGYAMPNGAYDVDSVLSCAPGMALLDTENPDMGRSGIVCRPV